MHTSTIAAALETPYAFAPALPPGAVVGTPVPVAACVPDAEVFVARVADALKSDVADALLMVDSAVALLRTLDAEDAIDADEAADEDDADETADEDDADEAADEDDAADELTDETDATLDTEADDEDNDDDDEAARVADAEDGRGVIDLTVLPDSITNGGV